MKVYIPVVARVLLGFVFFASGIAGLFNLVPMPADLPPDMMTFNQGLMASHYFMPFLKIVEIICGVMLLSGFFVPLALVILAPVLIHIFLVHLFLAPEGVPLAIILGLIAIYLSFFSKYSPKIRALFSAK